MVILVMPFVNDINTDSVQNPFLFIQFFIVIFDFMQKVVRGPSPAAGASYSLTFARNNPTIFGHV